MLGRADRKVGDCTSFPRSSSALSADPDFFRAGVERTLPYRAGISWRPSIPGSSNKLTSSTGPVSRNGPLIRAIPALRPVSLLHAVRLAHRRPKKRGSLKLVEARRILAQSPIFDVAGIGPYGQSFQAFMLGGIALSVAMARFYAHWHIPFGVKGVADGSPDVDRLAAEQMFRESYSSLSRLPSRR